MRRFCLPLFLFSLAILVGCDSAPASAEDAPKPMSKGESKKALDELVTLMEGAKAGDINSFNTNFKPTTKIVQRTKDLLIQKQKDEAEYTKAIAKLELEETLAIKNLATAKGRAKMLANIDQAEKLDNANYAASTKFLNDLSKILASFGAKVSPDQAVLLEAQNQELIAAGEKLWGAWRKLISLCESAKPGLEGEYLIFEKDEQVSKYTEFAKELEVAGTLVDRTMNRIMAQRQESMSNALSKMKSARDEL